MPEGLPEPQVPQSQSVVATQARVVLSWGLGVDSTAILLRWLADPACRDFDLSDLVVVVAMTGDEWRQTGALATEHVLPRLREHGVRLVQVARSGRYVRRDGTGVTVLDDSTHPARLHLEGAYALSDELLEAGTVPQAGGARLCSVHAKGDVLDPTIAELTAGERYRHAIGFETSEARRAAKDRGFNTATRTGWYPLIEWGWDRTGCETYLERVTGARWRKSACTYCPFALAKAAGLARVLAEFRADPAAGVLPLLIEHIAVALNPRQGLIGGVRLVDAVHRAGLGSVLAAHQTDLDQREHALYEVRRVIGATTSRAVARQATGTRQQMLAELYDTAAAHSARVDSSDGYPRVWLRRRRGGVPAVEHFLAVAPATVLDKARPGFESWWARAAAVVDADGAVGQQELQLVAGA